MLCKINLFIYDQISTLASSEDPAGLKLGGDQGFSYLSEVVTRGLLNLGTKKHLDHRNWENLMQSKIT